MCYKFKNACSMSPVTPSASLGMACIGGFSQCILPQSTRSTGNLRSPSRGFPTCFRVPIVPHISARCAEAGLVLLCHQSIILFAYLEELHLAEDSRGQAVLQNTCACFTITSSGIPDNIKRGCYISVWSEQRAEDFRSCLVQFWLGRQACFLTVLRLLGLMASISVVQLDSTFCVCSSGAERLVACCTPRNI